MLASILQLKDEMRATMSEADTERILIERAQRGDRAAFDELASSAAKNLLPRIHRRIGPGLREGLDPEDVLQETFFRAFRSIEKFEWQGEKSFESWLYGIAFKIILHSARERGKWNMLRIVQDPPGAGLSPSHQQRREERFDRLERSLARLSPEYRQVVQLVRIEGRSIVEVARQLHRPPSSVRNALLRAMKQLRQSFGDTESLGLPERSIEEGREDETS
jgi:RNA polymerase sigma-70 factor (ECF subfamily)